jgi:hypothetical protein
MDTEYRVRTKNKSNFIRPKSVKLHIDYIYDDDDIYTSKYIYHNIWLLGDDTSLTIGDIQNPTGIIIYMIELQANI